MSARSEKRPLVVGFVCEGSTDVVILRRVVETLIGPVDPRTLQPPTDELDRAVPGSASGWSEVRAWCRRVSDLREYFDPAIGDPFDLLVVSIDLDIAIRAGIQKRPENVNAYDAKALCDIVKSWLPTPLPGRVIIAIPVVSIESWVLAALFPRMDHPQHEDLPAQVLVRRKKIRMGTTGPWKRVLEYRGFAEVVSKKLKHVRDVCSEADRFANKLEAFGSGLRTTR